MTARVPAAGTKVARRAAVVALLSLVVLLLAPRPASAGVYDVYACYGGPNNSWVYWADPGMAAYDQCPANPGILLSGMITRNCVNCGPVGYLQGAYQVFSAPPGASLVHMTFNASIYRWEQHWTAGVIAFDGNFNVGELPWGCYAGQPGCGIVPPNFTGPYFAALNGHTQVRIESRCVNGAGCTVASTGYWPYLRSHIAIANVVVRVQDYTPPGVAPTGGSLLSGQWLRGKHGVSFHAADNVGVRETRVRIDGGDAGARAKGCDYTQRVPCPQGGDAYSVNTAALSDGAHTLTMEAVDTASNVGQAHRTILVDNSPPGQPRDLSVEGGEGWRARNGFRLTWQNPEEPGTAPIVAARYELCRADGSSCDSDVRSGKDIAAIDDLRVPGPGEYVARVWLRDKAGNEDPKTAAPPVRLRLDNEAPTVAFEQPDARDPGRVEARVFDAVSGIAGGEIELRNSGTGAWQPLGARLEGGRLIARIDDQGLPEGAHTLRARAVDRAGNERSTDRRIDGAGMEFVVPHRIQTQVRAWIVKIRRVGKKKKKRRKVRLVKRRRVRYGRRVRIVGYLTNESGAPLAFTDVTAFQMPRRDGARFVPVATLRTSPTGRFDYRAQKGPSRTLRFGYQGTRTVRSAADEVSMLVSAGATLKVNRRFALNGETVTFKGRLRGQPVPAEGKLVELQAYVRRRWRTFATTRTNERGRWKYPYRFDGTHGRQVYRFRARVPREALYPYETGRSRRVKVRVLGL